MKTLSIQQPWPWLICGYTGPDPKRIENRTRNSHYRGRFLIHASRIYDHAGADLIQSEFGIVIPDDLPLGGIVGVADLVGVVRGSNSRWFSGPFGYVLENATELPFVPCKGMLGFFNFDYSRTI